MTETPRVSDRERVTVTALSERIARVELRFGFMEKPDVPQGLQAAVALGQITPCNLAQVTYFTGHETIVAMRRRSATTRWRKVLFAAMHRNAQQPGAYFNIPTAQLMEIGVEFEI